MLKKLLITGALLLTIVSMGVLAQGTPTPAAPTNPTPAAPVQATPAANATAAGPESTIQFLFVACDTRAVVNLNGTMQPGFDVYYQIFDAADAGGNAITALRQVAVNGDYAFSETVNYNSGVTLATGATASIRVTIAREGSPSNTVFDDTANDVQDGCAEPQNPTGTSNASTGTTTTTTTGTTTSTVAGTGTTAAAPAAPAIPEILAPGAGTLNPGYVPTDGDDSDVRQETAGLVFAECRDFDVAEPGLLYDTDRVTVFWSWFASTPEQVRDHINNAIYEVGYFNNRPFSGVQVSDIELRDGLYWVFYTVDLGNVRPGFYPIQFKLRWRDTITDGFSDFGPGTETEQIISGCVFRVRENPFDETVNYTFP